jgi:hypothetical protein
LYIGGVSTITQPVEALSRGRHQRTHLVGREHQHRITVWPSGHEQGQPRVDLQEASVVTDQHVGQPLTFPDPEHLMQGRLAEVSIDQEHVSLRRAAQRERQIGGRQRLALGGQCAGHHHHLGAVQELLSKERHRQATKLLAGKVGLLTSRSAVASGIAWLATSSIGVVFQSSGSGSMSAGGRVWRSDVLVVGGVVEGWLG